MNDSITILRNLPGVNKEAFDTNINKHMVSVACMNPDELIEVISILDANQISYVKESGIVDFKSLTRTREEALSFANKNSNVISIDDYLVDSQSSRRVG